MQRTKWVGKVGNAVIVPTSAWAHSKNTSQHSGSPVKPYRCSEEIFLSVWCAFHTRMLRPSAVRKKSLQLPRPGAPGYLPTCFASVQFGGLKEASLETARHSSITLSVQKKVHWTVGGKKEGQHPGLQKDPLQCRSLHSPKEFFLWAVGDCLANCSNSSSKQTSGTAKGLKRSNGLDTPQQSVSYNQMFEATRQEWGFGVSPYESPLSMVKWDTLEEHESAEMHAR